MERLVHKGQSSSKVVRFILHDDVLHYTYTMTYLISFVFWALLLPKGGRQNAPLAMLSLRFVSLVRAKERHSRLLMQALDWHETVYLRSQVMF